MGGRNPDLVLLLFFAKLVLKKKLFLFSSFRLDFYFSGSGFSLFKITHAQLNFRVMIIDGDLYDNGLSVCLLEEDDDDDDNDNFGD